MWLNIPPSPPPHSWMVLMRSLELSNQKEKNKTSSHLLGVTTSEDHGVVKVNKKLPFCLTESSDLHAGAQTRLLIADWPPLQSYFQFTSTSLPIVCSDLYWGPWSSWPIIILCTVSTLWAFSFVPVCFFVLRGAKLEQNLCQQKWEDQ